jgi:hypothetical protein
MAYERPTAAFVRLVGGLRAAVEKLGEADLDAILDEFMPLAEAEFAVLVGETTFDSEDLSARKSILAQTGVCYTLFARYLFRPQTQAATGTHAPLRMSGEEMSMLRLDYVRAANRYALLISGGVDKVRSGLDLPV